MGKIIFWIVVVFLVLFALRMYNVAKARPRRKKPGEDAPAADGPLRPVRRVPAQARGARDNNRLSVPGPRLRGATLTPG